MEAKSKGPVRLLHAGRLQLAKGVGVLLAALRLLEERGETLVIDIIGTGEAREACLGGRVRSAAPAGPGSVPYGAPFFELGLRPRRCSCRA
ncbi:MAG: hypothetical protein IPJ19_18235 [Planctomycetes bacterium]|nr:hypothetical protein [Planctomycetota bacterium]